MGSIHDVNLFGRMNFVDGVQVAWLALKHRRNKNGGQRIVVFVGSPVHEEPKVGPSSGVWWCSRLARQN